MPHASPVSIITASERPPTPRAFRNFVEGMERFNNYLRSDNGEELKAASEAFASAANADPSFILARFHQAVAFAHTRREDEAIRIFEELIFEAPPFLAEVYYNLAQAYLHTYRYAEEFKAETAFDNSRATAQKNNNVYLMYLAPASKVLLYGVLGGRELRHPEDFQERKKKYLPAGQALGEDLLRHSHLRSLRSSEADDVRLEAHNGLGVVYMRMGQYSELLHRDPAEMWRNSETHYRACLALQPTLTPTLQNFGTLYRIEGHHFWQAGKADDARQAFLKAREYYLDSIRINRYDQFPYYGAAVSSAYLGDWAAASEYFSVGRKQHGQVRKDLWEGLETAISLRDASPLPPEESTES